MHVIDFILDISQIVLADIVLSGDNALIIGMAAASFAEKDRKKIIFFGLLAAADYFFWTSCCSFTPYSICIISILFNNNSRFASCRSFITVLGLF